MTPKTPDWDRLSAWLAEVVDGEEGILVPSGRALSDLIGLYGWQDFGGIVDSVLKEKKIRVLTRCGVPLEEAAKVAGLREVREAK